VVKAVGSPRARFSEDPARILRAVRFAACLGFAIEDKTGAAVRRLRAAARDRRRERIGKEILKMARRPGEALAAAVRLMIGSACSGWSSGSRDLQGLPQPSSGTRRRRLGAHARAAARVDISDPAVNLAVLLHDVGKALRTGRNGAAPLPGHDGAGAGLVEVVARRLFLPQRMRAAIAFAVGHHMQAGRLAELASVETAALVGSGALADIEALAICDWRGPRSRGGRRAARSGLPRGRGGCRDCRGRQAGAPVITGTRIWS